MDSRVQPMPEHAILGRDARQTEAIALLRQLVVDVTAVRKDRSSGFLAGWLQPARPVAAPGLYLWGGVGRGKTWLMDSFYQQVPIEQKIRLHFHHFLQYLHSKQQQLPAQSNPLDSIAREFAGRYRLLCLDEYQISDIGDAMLLYGVFQGLFRYGVTLVTTSNRHPDHLYKGGVQRAQVLPSIKLLKRHTRVFHLDGDVDYRTMAGPAGSDSYITPHDDHARRQLESRFHQAGNGEITDTTRLEINGRQLRVRRLSERCAWFDFEQLCRGPRAVSDYIQLARRFRMLIVSDVPALHEELESSARRFLHLVDEVYDRRVQLILSSNTPLAQLYQGDRLTFEFERALSRLYEMQSAEYLRALPVDGESP